MHPAVAIEANCSLSVTSVLNALILMIALLLTGYLVSSKRLARSPGWKATVTPLASIMGSGFLVSAPLLAGVVGNWAWLCMAALLLLAYLVGEAILFNIRYFEPVENKGHGSAQDLGFLSRLVMACAYFISVVYYLQLLSSFLINAVGQQSDLISNVIIKALLLTICFYGSDARHREDLYNIFLTSLAQKQIESRKIEPDSFLLSRIHLS